MRNLALIGATLMTLAAGDSFAMTILLDPGHGGEDLGARTTLRNRGGIYRRIYEKDIALEIAKRIHAKLKAKKYRSFLSRSVDRTVSLAERSDLAEKIRADIYISIHVNSSADRNSRGFETYYLDNHQNVAVKKVERVENKGVANPSLVRRILTDLLVERTEKSSKVLAKGLHFEIARKIGKRFKMPDRGIRPGLFFVLALAKRPAVLLEVGFMSNKRELNKILRWDFQESYAEAVVKGIERYRRKYLRSSLPIF